MVYYLSFMFEDYLIQYIKKSVNQKFCKILVRDILWHLYHLDVAIHATEGNIIDCKNRGRLWTDILDISSLSLWFESHRD